MRLPPLVQTPESEREFWNNQAYLEGVCGDPSDTERHVAMITSGAQHLPPGPVVEIGCGVGRLLALVARRTGRAVVGLDSSPAMVRHLGWDFEPVILTDGRALPEFFGVAMVYSMLTIQHLDPMTTINYLGAAAKWLRPGGALRIQFVVGERHEEMLHDWTVEDMQEAVGKAGLGALAEYDPVHPEWCWMTAVKP